MNDLINPAFILKEKMQEYNYNINKLSEITTLSIKEIKSLLSGDIIINDYISYELGKAFNEDYKVWLQRQRKYGAMNK